MAMRRNQPADTNNRDQGREIELADHPDFIWRWLKTNVSAAGNILGHAGYEMQLLKQALNLAEATIGPMLTAQAITAAAALVQVPDAVKDWIRGVGLPEPLIPGLEEFIDALFEGLGMALREDRSKVHDGDLGKASENAQKAFAAKVIQIKTFENVRASLTEPETEQFLAIVSKLDKVQRATFEMYKKRMATNVAVGVVDLKRLVATVYALPEDLRSAKLLEDLDGLYGPPPKPVVDSILERASGGFKAVEATLQRTIGVSDPNNDPVHQNLQAYAKRLRRRQSC